MTLLQIFILSFIQGITEFFPISSSGHLVVIEKFMSLPVSELRSFDVAVHFGSFIAIVIYFWADYLGLWDELKTLITNFKWENIKRSRLYLLFIGSVPAVIVGLSLNSIFDKYFRSTLLVGVMMILVGVYFLFAENFKQEKGKLTLRSVIWIGLSQAVAIIPGVSRSGSTISTGILLGLKREEAARFSFVLGSIAVFGAFLLTMMDVFKSGFTVPALDLLLGVVFSFISSILSIHFLMKLLKKYSLNIFAYYLFAIGSLILIFT